MKQIKILGFAVAAVMAVMAFAGAGSASAAVLCTTNEACSTSHVTEEGEMLDVGDVLVGTAKNLVLTATPEVKCSHSVTEVEVTEASPVAGEVTNLEFTGCAAQTILGPTPCSVAVENLPYAGTVTKGSGGNGTLNVSGISGDPEAFVECGGIIVCTYGNAEFKLPISGGNPVKITASNVPLTIQKGLLCPSEAKWDAVYEATGAITSVFVQ